MDISLVDGLVHKHTKLFHVLGYCIYAIASLTKVLLEFFQERVCYVLEVHSSTESLQDFDGRGDIVLCAFFPAGITDIVLGECKKGHFHIFHRFI